MKQSKQATYRILFFPSVKRYVGVAWNYEQAVLVGTRDRETYSDARNELTDACEALGVELRWFDGEHTIMPGEPLIPA